MRALKIIGFLLMGLIAGFAITAVLGLTLVPTRPADSGGREMAIFFGLAPLGGLIGAIAGAVIGARRKQPPQA